jgi:hypothetical protein
MRFFARVFLLGVLVIYVIVIGIQLIPRDGTGGVVETALEKGDEIVSSLKHFIFKDEELITIEGPGGIQIPIPVTGSSTPPTSETSPEPKKTDTSFLAPFVKSSSRGSQPRVSTTVSSTPTQTTPTTNTLPNQTSTQPPLATLTATCAGAVSGSDIVWTAEASGGSGDYSYSWAGGSYSTSKTYRVSYTTSGTKTVPLVVRDAGGRTSVVTCSYNMTIATTPIETPSSSITQKCNLDWCAPVAARPDQRYVNYSSCVPVWSTDEIAQHAKEVFYGNSGSELPNSLGIAAATTQCFGAQSLDKYRAYNDEIKTKATALGKTVYRVNAFRFDIVVPQVMAQPGFNASWLVRPATPHQKVLDFYANDTSSACGGVAGTCKFSYSFGGPYYEGKDTGKRLRDMIDASGGAGAYQNVVYYIARSNTGDTYGYAIAALADQRNSSYRAWRVAQAQKIIQDGHFDFVNLNHKFHFYKPDSRWSPPVESWLGSSTWAPNVTALSSNDNTPFSNPPLNYSYSDYVVGWNAFGKDLKNAGVPYTVLLNGGQWVATSNWNDPSTSIDEAALIRETAEGAGLIEMDYQSWLSSAQRTQLDQVVRDLEARGIIVIKLNAGCGYGSGTPSSCTTASADDQTIFGEQQIALASASSTTILPTKKQLVVIVITIFSLIAVLSATTITRRNLLRK